MITLKARFDGRVFVPESPVDLPAGTELEITIASPAAPPSSLARLGEIAEQLPDNPDLPTDLAEQHDHYLYGIPKRS